MNFDGDCIEHEGRLEKNGYAKIYNKISKKSEWAHRVDWEKYNGKIIGKFDVCHKCDNRACININHLFLGTRSDNMQDASLKGRIQAPRLAKTSCRNGHEYTKKNTATQSNGSRKCRICASARQQEYIRRKKDAII